MVTMSEVAARAGVSQATVSFVLGGRAERLKISPETQERVLSVARELGYQRNQLARAMTTGKSRILGVFTSPNASETIVRILAGAMEATSANDYLLKVIALSYSGVDDAAIARCKEWRIAGAMVVGLSDDSIRRLNEEFDENKMALAMIDNAPPVDGGIRILSDDEQGIGQAVSHLVALGHRQIAFLGGRPGYLSQWRETSFRAAMKERGLVVPAHWARHTSWSDQAVIEEGVRTMFQESGNRYPTAIVCCGDAIAMVVQRVARTLGLRLPQDLSITGYSDASLSSFADPSLTTIDQSFFEMGRVAAMHLIHCAENVHTGESAASYPDVLLPTRLIERKSTAPAPPF